MIKREHYKDLGYKPFMFYVIFGVTADQLQVSASRHHVNSVFVDDFDNDDFNNAYCKVEVLGKK